jgi:RNA polymerase sigma-70 factor (ECF subfamily)
VVGQVRDPRSDGEIALGLAAGEEWAVSAAWQRFAPLVLMTAERALGSKADAEDVTQEVFVRLLRSTKTLRDPDKLRSFVYSVALRTLQSHLRTRRFKAWISFQSPDTLVDPRHSTLDIESRDLLRKFYELLDRLPPRARLVFLMRRVEAMTIEEIAANLGVSISTVKRAMQHASTRLSRWVEDDPALAGFVHGGLEAK